MDFPFEKIQHEDVYYYEARAGFEFFKGLKDENRIHKWHIYEWYAVDEKTASTYGRIYKYKLKNTLKLLAMDEVNTIEMLISTGNTQNDKKFVDALKITFPIIENTVSRHSEPDEDKIVADFLHKNNFEGYAIKSLPKSFGSSDYFHPEVLICNPNNNIEYMDVTVKNIEATYVDVTNTLKIDNRKGKTRVISERPASSAFNVNRHLFNNANSEDSVARRGLFDDDNVGSSSGNDAWWLSPPANKLDNAWLSDDEEEVSPSKRIHESLENPLVLSDDEDQSPSKRIRNYESIWDIGNAGNIGDIDISDNDNVVNNDDIGDIGDIGDIDKSDIESLNGGQMDDLIEYSEDEIEDYYSEMVEMLY